MAKEDLQDVEQNETVDCENLDRNEKNIQERKKAPICRTKNE